MYEELAQCNQGHGSQGARPAKVTLSVYAEDGPTFRKPAVLTTEMGPE